MIHEVDEAIQSLMSGARIGGSGVELAFDAPTKEWAARRTSPVLDFYLYDIREELQRRAFGSHPERDGGGFIVAWRPPPRYFRLSYLVTAWTQRPEDEHRLLAGVLGFFAALKGLPPSVLTGSMAELGLPAFVSIARPPADDRQVPEVWSSLGGELKPSLDLAVTAPMAPEAAAAAAGLVLEPLILETMDTVDGATERVQARRRDPDEPAARAGFDRLPPQPAGAGAAGEDAGKEAIVAAAKPAVDRGRGRR